MPRIRYLKHDFFLDEELAERSPHARLLFAGLWLLADRDGRLEDRPMRIKAQLFPYEDVDVDKLLEELAPAFLVRYQGTGKALIQIKTFEKHQRPHPREAASLLPAPSDEDLAGGNTKARPAVKGREKARGNRDGDGDGDGDGSVPEPRQGAARGELGPKGKDSNDLRLARALKGLILRNDTKTKTPRSLIKWTDEAERLIRIDERGFEEAIEVMTYALADPFWQSNILSMAAFRKQYDRLRLRLKEKRNGTQAPRCRICSAHPARAESPICAVCAYCRHCGSVRGPWRLFKRSDQTQSVACMACVTSGRLKRQREPDEHKKHRGGLKHAAGAISTELRGGRRG